MQPQAGMALYAMMATFTEKGAADVRELPARIKAFKEMAKTAGAEVKQCLLAMGRFDAISIVNAPNDEVMAKVALGLCSVGNAKTETFRLFNEEEIAKLASGLPKG
jgi:uncharacterized protein with GYD domain